MRDDPDIENIKAGDEFRRTLIDKADANRGGSPLWYGWAIMDAFLAGIRWERARRCNEMAQQPPQQTSPPVNGTGTICTIEWTLTRVRPLLEDFDDGPAESYPFFKNLQDHLETLRERRRKRGGNKKAQIRLNQTSPAVNEQGDK